MTFFSVLFCVVLYCTVLYRTGAYSLSFHRHIIRCNVIFSNLLYWPSMISSRNFVHTTILLKKNLLLFSYSNIFLPPYLFSLSLYVYIHISISPSHYLYVSLSVSLWLSLSPLISPQSISRNPGKALTFSLMPYRRCSTRLRWQEVRMYIP